MSRPRPIVLLEFIDQKTYRSDQVLKAGAIYAVFYDGQPINLRSLNSLVNYPGPKYKKVSFSNPGHSFNLKDRLNKLFRTDKFQVVMLNSGTIIQETDETG